jgi:hypothetical protein
LSKESRNLKKRKRKKNLMSMIALSIPISRRKDPFSTLMKMQTTANSILRSRIIRCLKTSRILLISIQIKVVLQRNQTVQIKENSRDFSAKISSQKWMKVIKKTR